MTYALVLKQDDKCAKPSKQTTYSDFLIKKASSLIDVLFLKSIELTNL